MRLKFLLFISSLALVLNATFAQTLDPYVYSAKGGYYTQSIGNISWTIGETETNTWVAPAIMLSEGFQQPEIQITTGTVPTSICEATTNISVPFTTSGYVDPGNIFTAQLSDTSGSFANPVTIGTYGGGADDVAGTINATLPNNLYGSGYRIRVVSTNPAFSGPDNGSDISFHSDNWTGSISTDWFTAGNWTCGIPDSTTDVLIPNGKPNYPIIAGSVGGQNAKTHSMTIDTGGTLNVSGINNIGLEINGNYTVRGHDSIGGGAIYFKGTAPQTIFRDGDRKMHNMVVNNINGVTISTTSGRNRIYGTLTLEKGTLTNHCLRHNRQWGDR